MRNTVAVVTLLAGTTLAVAPAAAAPKPPVAQYHFTSHGKDNYLASLSDNGLAGGNEKTSWGACGGQTIRYMAAVWDINVPSSAPDWLETLPASCDYCFSQISMMGADGTWGVGPACDPVNGPSSDGCHCNETIPALWERDWTSPTLNFVRVELGDPLPGEALAEFFTGAAGSEPNRIAIRREAGLFRETSTGWSPEAYTGAGQRWSINDTGIAAGHYWDAQIRAYRTAAWDCTVPGCAATPVTLDYSWPSAWIRFRINSFGDIVGATRVWRYSGTWMTWDNSEPLPVGGFGSCEARASERVGAKLIVVGACDDYGVRWTSTQPGQWTGPEKIETLDDASAHVRGAHDINSAGQILGWYGRAYTSCAETPK